MLVTKARKKKIEGFARAYRSPAQTQPGAGKAGSWKIMQDFGRDGGG